MSRVAPTGALRQRDPRQHDRPYMGWVKSLPCIACLAAGVVTWGSEAAHIKMGFPDAGPGWRDFGAQEKSHDWRTWPGCSAHHRVDAEHRRPRAQHSLGEPMFWSGLRMYPPAVVASLRASYEAGLSGIPVVQAAISAGRAAFRAT